MISPCVTFNDHEGSTKSYLSTRERHRSLAPVDFVQLGEEITADYGEGEALSVAMHDGSRVRFRKLDAAYDPTDRDAAYARVREHQLRGEVVTGLLYLEEGAPDMRGLAETLDAPLTDLPHEALCPGAAALEALQREMV